MQDDFSIIDLCAESGGSDNDAKFATTHRKQLGKSTQYANRSSQFASVAGHHTGGSFRLPLDLAKMGDESSDADTGVPLIPTKPRKGRGRPRKRAKVTYFSVKEFASFTSTAEAVYFEVAGTPLLKKRAAYGRNLQHYNPSKNAELDFVAVVERIFKEHVGAVPKFAAKSALAVRISFFFPYKPPLDEGKIFATADIDNLCKFVMDALNAVLYDDDRQIVELVATKAFDAENAHGRTTVAITKK
jgi:Holliday junction resolvase RusA-like endonuclease